MLKTIFESIDEPSALAIEKAQALVESDALLAGLGQNCADYAVPANFSVIQDLKRSVYLLTSQEMWEDDSKDQYFADIRTEAVNIYKDFDKQEQRRRSKCVRGKTGDLTNYLNPIFEGIISKHGIVEYLHEHNSGSYDLQETASVMEQIYVDVLSIFILDIVKAGFFGGLDKWPSAQYYYECLLTGGYPTGWIGEPPESGGIAADCVQLLHYGPQVKS